jgi:hypothetical protein
MASKGPNFLITPQEVQNMDMAEKKSENASNLVPSFNREQSSMISVGQIKE